MLLVLLWLWSNEDLLNLGFREFLMIELLIQPLPLKFELEVSIPSCFVDISQSIFLPATHTISPMYWSCAPIFCTFESLCLDTETRTPSTTGTSITQSRTELAEQPPLHSESSRLLKVCFISSTFGSSYELQTILD